MVMMKICFAGNVELDICTDQGTLMLCGCKRNLIYCL